MLIINPKTWLQLFPQAMVLLRRRAEPISAFIQYVIGPLSWSRGVLIDQLPEESSSIFFEDLQTDLKSEHVQHGKAPHGPESGLGSHQRQDADEKAVNGASVHTCQKNVPSARRIRCKNTGEVADDLGNINGYSAPYLIFTECDVTSLQLPRFRHRA